MDPIVLLVIGLFIASIIFRIVTNPIVKKAEAQAAANKHVVKVKQCPPHQWFYQDIVDEAGTYQGARLVCKLCGPINTGGSSDEG